MPKIIRLAPETLSAAAEEITAALRIPGSVALVPTETVYGLICRAGDQAACSRIFSLKGRAGSKLLGWFIRDEEMAKKHGIILNSLSSALIKKYTPGALTIISRKDDGTTQGFRRPDHPLLLDILKRLREPLVQTSANASGMADAESTKDALRQLNGDVDIAVDGGTLAPGSMGSTVVDATGEELKILRQGKLAIPVPFK